MRQTLNSALIQRYYSINTGFFLFLFYILFGIFSGTSALHFHHFVMLQISTHSLLMLGAAFLWMLYALKCLFYLQWQLKDTSYTFLYVLQCLPDRAQLKISLGICASLLAPVLAYGCVAVVVGLVNGQYVLPVLFVTFQAGLVLCLSIWFRNLINSTWKPPIFAFRLPSLPLPNWYHLYLIRYSLHMRKGTFLALKLVSALVLQLMVLASTNTINREAVSILTLLLIASHSLMPHYYVRFAEERMNFLRNLPLSLASRFLMFAITYAVIFLPEIAFLAINGKHALRMSFILSLYCAAIAQLSLYTSLLYTGMKTDKYTLWVAVLFFIPLLLLASVNMALLASVEMLIALLVFTYAYYRYEPPVTAAA